LSLNNDVFIVMPFELLTSVNVLGQIVGSSWAATYCLSMVMLLHAHIHAGLTCGTVALIDLRLGLFLTLNLCVRTRCAFV
jgi:hypothetical protein